MVALQNLVAYSVNMIDNVMMGSYSQTALSGRRDGKPDFLSGTADGHFSL